MDEVTYEVLPYMEEGLDTAAIVGKLGDQFSEEDIKTSVAECEKLKADGMLFTRDVYENAIDTFTKNRQTVVKALCLHTVSYTHLDVYKRQVLKCFFCFKVLPAQNNTALKRKSQVAFVIFLHILIEK